MAAQENIKGIKIILFLENFIKLTGIFFNLFLENIRVEFVIIDITPPEYFVQIKSNLKCTETFESTAQLKVVYTLYLSYVS